MAASTIGGAEGGGGIFGGLYDLAGQAATIYGNVQVAKQRTRQDQLAGDQLVTAAVTTAGITNSRYKWLAIAGVGLILSIVLLRKVK